MIRIINTCRQIGRLFDGTGFLFDQWEAYINAVWADSAHIFKDEVDGYVRSGRYTFEKDFLPVINAVYNHPCLEVLQENFSAVTGGLNRKVLDRFGKELSVDVVLYLGLCNGAGWVTRINGTDAVLLGIEKILELGWHTAGGLTGLVYHELGHVYHAQHGVLEQSSGDRRRETVWQLFTEGIAMYFEQALVGDFHYYHQDKDGWTAWCDAHFPQILADFDRDLSSATRFTQRYFGDWCDYRGHGDVGYYLGCRFVQELMAADTFDSLIRLDIDRVYSLYGDFAGRRLG